MTDAPSRDEAWRVWKSLWAVPVEITNLQNNTKRYGKKKKKENVWKSLIELSIACIFSWRHQNKIHTGGFYICGYVWWIQEHELTWSWGQKGHKMAVTTTIFLEAASRNYYFQIRWAASHWTKYILCHLLKTSRHLFTKQSEKSSLQWNASPCKN